MHERKQALRVFTFSQLVLPVETESAQLFRQEKPLFTFDPLGHSICEIGLVLVAAFRHGVGLLIRVQGRQMSGLKLAIHVRDGCGLDLLPGRKNFSQFVDSMSCCLLLRTGRRGIGLANLAVERSSLFGKSVEAGRSGSSGRLSAPSSKEPSCLSSFSSCSLI